MSRRAAIAAAAVLAAGVLSGCAQPGTQAPKAEAKKLNDGTASVTSACATAEQLMAFGGSHPAGLAAAESSAAADVDDLVAVWRKNRTWIYQGETINGLVSDTILLLGDCGLPGAQRRLQEAVTPGLRRRLARRR